MSARPRTVVLVAGTGTDVGKTWVAAQLLAAWRHAGYQVAARKPAQSYELPHSYELAHSHQLPESERPARSTDRPGSGASVPSKNRPRSAATDLEVLTDAEVLGAASGEPATTVCRSERWYPVPLAPPMAAEVLGRPGFTVADLVAELDWPRPAVDFGVLEVAGGVRSPQASDGDAVDVACLVQPDQVVLVADAGLGTINGVRLAVEALATVTAPAGCSAPVNVVLNRFDPAASLHERNRRWLAERCGLRVTAVGPGALSALAARLAPAG